MNIAEQLQIFLAIEDSEIGTEAILAWYGTLSPDQKKEVDIYITSLLDYMHHLFESLQSILGPLLSEAAAVLHEWYEKNPEIQQYRKALSGQ